MEHDSVRISGIEKRLLHSEVVLSLVAKELHPDDLLIQLYEVVVALGPSVVASGRGRRQVADDPNLLGIGFGLFQLGLEVLQLVARIVELLHEFEVLVVTSLGIEEDHPDSGFVNSRCDIRACSGESHDWCILSVEAKLRELGPSCGISRNGARTVGCCIRIEDTIKGRQVSFAYSSECLLVVRIEVILA